MEALALPLIVYFYFFLWEAFLVSGRVGGSGEPWRLGVEQACERAYKKEKETEREKDCLFGYRPKSSAKIKCFQFTVDISVLFFPHLASEKCGTKAFVWGVGGVCFRDEDIF